MEITRFPHYHQAENVVTNHIMVMFRMISDSSPKLLEALLKALCDEEVSIGPRFSQQISGSHSVPDGLIVQEPLAIFIETKLGPATNTEQLQRHCKTIVERLPGRKGCFLVSLTASVAGQSLPKELDLLAKEYNINVINATFGELTVQIKELPVTDLSLREAIQEFCDFIFANNLVPREQQWMVAMLTGTSWKDNLFHRVYFEPIERNPKWPQASFMGLYHEKKVSHVGRILAAVGAIRDKDGNLLFDKPEIGEIGDSEREMIRESIEAAQIYYPSFELRRHRYYVLSEFELIDFVKSSPGGMMGHRYFDIEAIGGQRLPHGARASLAADLLRGKTFS